MFRILLQWKTKATINSNEIRIGRFGSIGCIHNLVADFRVDKPCKRLAESCSVELLPSEKQMPLTALNGASNVGVYVT